jgi:hypothetical protein
VSRETGTRTSCCALLGAACGKHAFSLIVVENGGHYAQGRGCGVVVDGGGLGRWSLSLVVCGLSVEGRKFWLSARPLVRASGIGSGALVHPFRFEGLNSDGMSSFSRSPGKSKWGEVSQNEERVSRQPCLTCPLWPS